MNIICLNPRDVILVMIPYGHAKTCELCCLKVMDMTESNSKCPVCQMTVNSDIKAFYSLCTCTSFASIIKLKFKLNFNFR